MSDGETKYKTLSEFVEAHKAGTLPAGTTPITLDSSHWYAYAPVPGGDEDDWECVFRIGAHDGLTEALRLLGVPSEDA